MASDTLPQISSLAAPTKEDEAILRTLSDEQYRALLAAHLEEGRRDIREGRYTELKDADDIRAFFDRIWPIDTD